MKKRLAVAALLVVALALVAGRRVAQLPQPDHRLQPPDPLVLVLPGPLVPRVAPAPPARPMP